MQTPTRTSGTTPWEVLPYPATLIFPVKAWIAGYAHSHLSTFFCRAPRGRLVTLSYLNTPRGNELHEFTLLPEGLTELESLAHAHSVFLAKVAEHERDNPRELPLESGSPFVRRNLNSVWFADKWDKWAQRLKEVKLLSCVSHKAVAVMAAQLLGPTLRASEWTPSGEALRALMEDGIVPVEPGTATFLAYFLGLLADSRSEGAAEIARELRFESGASYHAVSTQSLSRHLTRFRLNHEGRPLAAIVWRMLMRMPKELLLPHQAQLDEFLWSNPTKAEHFSHVHPDCLFLGPLPVRMSLAQVLCELLHVETLAAILLWADDRPLLHAA